jgi:hypothetical protein
MKSSALVAPLLALVATSAVVAASTQALPPIEYVNKGTPGPHIIVLPGEIKTSSEAFKARYSADNIADWGELELGNANFKVLERSDLGPVLQEIRTAYTLGDTDSVSKVLQKGKLKTTKYIIKFDVLKADMVEKTRSGVDVGTVARTGLNIFGGNRDAYRAANVADTVHTQTITGTWLIGLRYKVIDVNTTEQVASGYHEETVEVGGGSTTAFGISGGKMKALSLDSVLQRLVQEDVADIDARNK